MTGCCSACRAYQKSQRPLIGTQWQLVQLGGQMITPQEGQFTLQFVEADHSVRMMGACNRMMAKFTDDERHALQITDIAGTRRMCRDMKTEQKFVEALQSTTHYDMDGPMMMLLSNGELRAILQSLPDKE